MRRTPVESETIASIGYDPGTRILEIEFRDHAVYQYFDVPARMHEQMMQAGSKGTFLNQVLKKAGYRYRRTEPGIARS